MKFCVKNELNWNDTWPHTQQTFEDRLTQQLEEINNSIVRNFEKILGQKLGELGSSISSSHEDSQRIEGTLFNMAGILCRLETKLDKLAERLVYSNGSVSPTPL